MALGQATGQVAIALSAWLGCAQLAAAQTHAAAHEPAASKRSRDAGVPERGRTQDETEYRKLQQSWHAPAAPPLVVSPEPLPRVPLVLSAVNGGEDVVLVPERDDGGFRADDLQRAARVFAQQSIRKVHPLAPRLLDLVYRSMRHFDAMVVHVVSGYRRDRAGSRHTQGRAVDMVVAGVSNEQLAKYVRTLGFVGVGIYPKSGFVHLDVRDASYFWSDDSAPGEPSQYTPILEAEARHADAAARARGEAPDVAVPNNQAEDAAAAKEYARRARQRQLAAKKK